MIYAGTFVIAFATLALEVSLTRLLSVVTWYHLAFFAISTAMLGMTAGAVAVYTRATSDSVDVLQGRLAQACLGFGITVPLSLVVLAKVPFSTVTMGDTVLSLSIVTLACVLPFAAAGVALALVLTRYPLPVSRIYASDLVGAALGCLFVLGALEVLDVLSLILLCGALGGVAAVLFGWRVSPGRTRLGMVALTAGLCAAALINAATPWGLEIAAVKGRRAQPEQELIDRWNSFSRVVVYRGGESAPFFWSASPRAPRPAVWQHYMDIDGEAGTSVTRYDPEVGTEYLRYDVTNVAYFLRPSGGAAVIGVGGGRDVRAALEFGHERVTGVEVNPIFIELLQDEFSEMAGLAGRDDVTLVVDDARSYLSRTDERFSLIQMSMIDTWAATGAGAYSHTESGLYTVEAWSIFLRRLRDDGVLTVSRWHSASALGETARALSLAVAALHEMGVENASAHVALVTTPRLSSLIVGRAPLTEADLGTLGRVSEELEYTLSVVPGTPPEHPMLRAVLGARDREELEAVAATATLDISPPTDESPYFFNMLRFRNVWGASTALFQSWDQLPDGVLRGNLIATGVLIGLVGALMLLAVGTVIVPLLIRAPLGGGGIHWAGAAFFSLIGAAFMMVEIGLIQRLSVFLGHPVYALGILLFTIILSTGIGSYLTEWLPLTRRPGRLLFPVATAVAVAVVTVLFPVVAQAMEASPRLPRIFVSIAMLMPVGILMGFFFPTGMRLMEANARGETPWYWALNGVFGVLFSAVAVVVAIHFGIATNLWAGMCLYLATLLVLPAMGQDGGSRPAGAAGG